ncbi:MAG: 2-C-methyl-D-erythritol 4-phosphate cytidylyltransferase [Clostridia bacterium]|nr:2-C-methyl-D-erythritol 4-phosphate cytidylyltransferase [Clostridia bacterium]
MNAALILSGGVGARFGASVPKQYTRILRKMVIEYVIEAAMQAKTIDVVMVAGADSPQLKRLKKKYGFHTAPGGSVRNETLQNGLTALRAMGCERVVILDAVRPLVTGALLDDYTGLLQAGWDAVSTVQPITDSLGCLDCHAVDRSRYYLMQSPEGYDLVKLLQYFDPGSPLTEVAHQLPADSRIYLYRDFPENPKLTYPWERNAIAQALKERVK